MNRNEIMRLVNESQMKKGINAIKGKQGFSKATNPRKSGVLIRCNEDELQRLDELASALKMNRSEVLRFSFELIHSEVCNAEYLDDIE